MRLLLVSSICERSHIVERLIATSRAVQPARTNWFPPGGRFLLVNAVFGSFWRMEQKKVHVYGAESVHTCVRSNSSSSSSTAYMCACRAAQHLDIVQTVLHSLFAIPGMLRSLIGRRGQTEQGGNIR